MQHLKIGIVEDDLLIAESILVTLRQIGYLPSRPARSYEEALKMIEAENPDLMVVDITLEGKPDGIDLAMKINKDYGIPFIFLTAYSDQATINRAKEVNPYAYLVKPFTEHDLFSAIEIAFNNYNKGIQAGEPAKQAVSYLKDVIFIKEGDLFHKVEIKDILYVESDNVYLNIYTAKKHFVIRMKLDDFIKNLSQREFFRVHRSYAINIKHLETINDLSVKVAGNEIPIHRNYRQELLQAVRSVK